MGTRYLLDTSVVAKYLQKRYEPAITEKILQIMEKEAIFACIKNTKNKHIIHNSI